MTRNGRWKPPAAAPSVIMAFSSLGIYRLKGMLRVKERLGNQLMIFAGDRARDAAVRVIDPSQLPYHVARNVFLLGDVTLQLLPVPILLRAPIVVTDLNPRMPHVWALLVLRRLLKRPTLLWGHAFPRAGRASPTERLRHLMRQLSSGLITYTETDAESLREIHPGKRIVSAPNAIYSRSEFEFDELSRRDSFVYVGRMARDKKPILAIKAFELVSARFGSRYRLVFVGDGDLLGETRAVASASPASDCIRFLGYRDSRLELTQIYASAIASISPGFVGLSVTQSVSFGVPMIVSRDEHHAPEIEVLEEGKNGLFFKTDDPVDLARMMIEVIEYQQEWKERGRIIAEDARRRYSAEAMADGIVEAVRNYVNGEA